MGLDFGKTAQQTMTAVRFFQNQVASGNSMPSVRVRKTLESQN